MKHTTPHTKLMSIFAHLKLHSIALANLLVAIATLPSAAHGFETYNAMVPMSDWCLMGVVTLLTITLAVNYTALAKLIPMLKRFLLGGKQIYIKLFKN